MRKILVVEDSLVMRDLIGSLIDELGACEITAVENGLQALRVLPSEKFDLIVTDINMPNINGLELLAFVKKNPNHVDAYIARGMAYIDLAKSEKIPDLET